MNFRLTKLKILISLIVGYIIVYFGSWFFCLGGKLCPIGPIEFTTGFLGSLFSLNFESLLAIFYMLIVSGMVYLIWSLIQKK